MAKVSHTTVATALRHGRGSLGALLAIVTALGGDETEFKVLLKTADQSQQPRWKSELEQARREEADFRQRLLGELTAIRKLLEGGRHD